MSQGCEELITSHSLQPLMQLRSELSNETGLIYNTHSIRVTVGYRVYRLDPAMRQASSFSTPVYTYLLSCARVLSCVQVFATQWTIAHLAPLTKGFSRQEYWSVLPFPAPEDLPDPGIKTEVTCISCIVRWILYHHASWELPRLKEPLDSQRVDDNMKTGLRRRETAWCGEDFQNMCREHFANPPQRSQWERREAGDRRRKKNMVPSVFMSL